MLDLFLIWIHHKKKLSFIVREVEHLFHTCMQWDREREIFIVLSQIKLESIFILHHWSPLHMISAASFSEYTFLKVVYRYIIFGFASHKKRNVDCRWWCPNTEQKNVYLEHWPNGVCNIGSTWGVRNIYNLGTLWQPYQEWKKRVREEKKGLESYLFSSWHYALLPSIQNGFESSSVAL